MASFKALCLAGVASLVATAAAHAADLLPPPPPVEYAPPAPLVVGGGWYLRGDVGEGNLTVNHGVSTFAPDYPYGTANGYPPGFTRQDAYASAQVITGLGAGYQINGFFRADVTGEYRFNSKYHAVEGYTSTVYGGGADLYKGSIQNGLILANGYVDIGTWCHLTPYVGAGVGVAFNNFGTIVDYNAAYYGKASGQSDSRMTTQLAYAFMAGVAYDITPNLKLDFGYRFVDMGRIQSGVLNCYGGSNGCGDNSHEVQSYHLYANDIRVGLRYAFADLLPVVQPPLVRKY